MELSLEDISDLIGGGLLLLLAAITIVGFLAVVIAILVNPSNAPAVAVGWLAEQVIPWWVGPLQFLAVASPIGAVIFLLIVRWLRAD